MCAAVALSDVLSAIAERLMLRGFTDTASDLLAIGLNVDSRIINNDKVSDHHAIIPTDTVADDSTAAAFAEIEERGRFVPLHHAVDGLPQELRDVIREYYFMGLSYKQIGERHGYGEDYARRLRNKALRRLQNNTALRRCYGADYGLYNYSRHKSLASFLSSGTSEVEDYVMRRLACCTGATK